MSKRILILNAGGTIGMRHTAHGYVPDPDFTRQLQRMVAASRVSEVAEYAIRESARLIDSANLTAADWHRIAAELIDQYADYDGFVVLHGTDTMAYTASALSFVLQGLRKSVIVTGSQIPLRELRNDAHNNLTDALLLAARGAIPEVGLYFNGRLLRGNRATKVRSGSLDAFEAPNYPPLAEAGVYLRINDHAVLDCPAAEHFQLPPEADGRVAVLKLFPGISPEFLTKVLEPPLRGLILECYGLGNAPTEAPRFLQALSDASGRGVPVVAVSQCLHGRIDLNKYAAGSVLAQAGVISGLDMTTEAAFTKLNHLLAIGMSGAGLEETIQRSLCGECTPDQDTAGFALPRG